MADKNKTEGYKTEGYKLRPGARHWHDGALVEQGEVVQLTEAQARSFADKFVKADAPARVPAPEAPALRPRPSSGVAQDAGARAIDPAKAASEAEAATAPEENLGGFGAEVSTVPADEVGDGEGTGDETTEGDGTQPAGDGTLQDVAPETIARGGKKKTGR